LKDLKFDAIRFCEDYNIDYWLEGKNVSPGWVAVQCPFCGDTSNHGAFNPVKAYYSCWKCGWHSVYNAVKEITGEPNVKPILKKYGLLLADYTNIKDRLSDAGTKEFVLPGSALQKPHKDYLLSRRFDPDFIEKKYGVLGTLDHEQYAYRIITPVFWDGDIVSFLGRDYTNKQLLRHKDCPIEMAKVYHKNILYDLNHCYKRSVIVVEGAYDNWRLGDNVCATLGTGWTTEQALLLAKRFDNVFIFYDKGVESQKKAKGLGLYLNGLGIYAETISTDYDEPDDMAESDITYLKKELGVL
jgi:DNA primase